MSGTAGIPAVHGREEVNCPWCGSGEVERVGEVGPTVMTSQWICRACRTPFERIRRRGGDPPREEG
jgi:ring-1,2-phenylacetyl-CoA epoxidase subunit PaaD